MHHASFCLKEENSELVTKASAVSGALICVNITKYICLSCWGATLDINALIFVKYHKVLSFVSEADPEMQSICP
jgi:hypothetical protein